MLLRMSVAFGMNACGIPHSRGTGGILKVITVNINSSTIWTLLVNLNRSYWVKGCSNTQRTVNIIRLHLYNVCKTPSCV